VVARENGIRSCSAAIHSPPPKYHDREGVGRTGCFLLPAGSCHD
jgi:hypothetical protein